MEEQERQEGPLPPPPDRERSLVIRDLERPEQAEAQTSRAARLRHG